MVRSVKQLKVVTAVSLTLVTIVSLSLVRTKDGNDDSALRLLFARNSANRSATLKDKPKYILYYNGFFRQRLPIVGGIFATPRDFESFGCPVTNCYTTDNRKFDFAMVFPKFSPVSEDIKKAALDLVETGLVKLWLTETLSLEAVLNTVILKENNLEKKMFSSRS